MRIGELLVRSGKITEYQLNLALNKQKIDGGYLGQILIQMGFITSKDLASALSNQFGFEFVELQNYHIDPAVVKLIPPVIVRKNKLLPLSVKNGSIRIAMADPFDVMAIDEVKIITNKHVEVAVADEKELLMFMERIYKEEENLERTGDVAEDAFHIGLEEGSWAVVSEIDEPEPGTAKNKFGQTGTVVIEEGKESAIEIIGHIIAKALKNGATDIHVEPVEDFIRIRYRIDGVLHESSRLQKGLQSAIITRIKIMANLDISEGRIPQDGRATFVEEGREVNLRVSTLPTVFGENIVIRILDSSKIILGLDRLGFSSQVFKQYTKAIQRQNGIILVTGPTGSGKTTTLYSTLSQLNSKEKNIITLEDPVEYLFPAVRQCQINPKAGLTFASGLRSILRHDPDIILVGEIRDVETMEMSIRSALTGHLVFSTLHTNDAAGAVTRLLDMGAEHFLLASTLVAVLSQRLVRVICEGCKEEYSPDEGLLQSIKWEDNMSAFYRGRGCALCNQTGYRGRVGIFELLINSPGINHLIMERKESQAIKEAAREEGMTTMMEDGMEKVKQGITTVEELVRVVYA